MENIGTAFNPGNVVKAGIINGFTDSEGYYVHNSGYSSPRTYTDLKSVLSSYFDEKSKDKTLSYIAEYPWSDGSTTPKKGSDFRYDNIKADVEGDKDILYSDYPSELEAYYKRYIISVESTSCVKVSSNHLCAINLRSKSNQKNSIEPIRRLTRQNGDNLIMVIRNFSGLDFPKDFSDIQLEYVIKDTFPVCSKQQNDNWWGTDKTFL